ncbi:putative spermidine/putrescine transport system substrate-binding protein [Pseudoxanthobacter soli DSM 19599]|uniref:Putative spermidine/putrescine transport system substrate-binding protein n=1 Tax=Pseudoxanthobacter soli DSM 19599 TaxID=1123029 RepID=A0A1M7ZNF6_9HYPH|nr:extracellular solute-binding protein [Pseudoxanthobacter soli]SHO66433.1 putative spermidine/putrescine transport system substrate-binding protein [Pseudoxanthobacter soli DSM 19599]
MHMNRRRFLATTAALTSVPLFGGKAFAALKAPSTPVTLTVADVAGNLALTQAALQLYADSKPEWVSRIAFTKAPAPELPSKLKAQQAAGRVDIDLVLTGTDALSAGLAQNIWTDLAPYKADLPDLQAILIPQAFKMQAIADDHGVVVSYYPSGPLIEYMPDRVPTPPKTAEELLEWTRQHKNKFLYARPANSGPGRTFLMGLPYILKDSDPKDPEKGWDKTWAYLEELGQNIEYYPSGTTQTMRELGEGTRDIVASTTGWDINPRVLGTVPAEAQVGTLAGFHWVTDAHYMVVPKGVSEEKLAVLLDLMNFMLTPKAQAYAYDEGYFYPGPAVKDVPLSMAPEASQQAIKEFGRPEYDKWIADAPLEVPLDADKIVAAFRIWDERIGAKKT